ncbi:MULTISPECIES: hypothetical protein [unclassified Streptomyces]|uniref:hypothetical protein n=1 Tax=unclassified Streptomyces TaxID=2593676 RepID=UPI00386AC488|nr:hypothetical protein OG331_03555 [Streptomyces sp. NBC_01017]WSV34866.1 hypothetical protein OG331_48425 [Streptomyces sp. NBC_01017]
MEHVPSSVLQRRRDQKRRAYLAAIGRPALCADFQDVQAYIRKLYFEGGMSAEQMHKQSGVSLNIVLSVIRGHRGIGENGRPTPIVAMRRTTIDRLTAMQYEPPMISKHGAGARVNPQTTLRRIQTLIAQGYNLKWLSRQHDSVSDQHLSTLLTQTKGRRYIMATTAHAIAELYDKYHNVDPAHVGISQAHIVRAQHTAQRRGYTPPSCWDADTIDDPDAVPEWTGACGTEEGYLIHKRERLPVCPACAVYRKNYTYSRKYLAAMSFSARKLDQILNEPGRAPLRIARSLGHPNGDTLEMWRKGTRRPQHRNVAKLAALLAVRPEDLCDILAPTAQG